MNVFRGRFFLLGLLVMISFIAQAQRDPDRIVRPNILTVKLFPKGDPIGYPVMRLGSLDQLQLSFDDMDADVKNYYYTLELCNTDWTPVQMGYMDYIRGFNYIRINNYRFSSIALTRYTNYQASIPDRNLYPSKSGNYLLRVFLDGDTSRVAFTKRLMVFDDRMSVTGQVQQPYNQNYFRTHHKIMVGVSARQVPVSYPQQQIKVVILQNQRWDNAIVNVQPSIMRGDYYEFNAENNFIFPGGKEWRWLDLRSFRLLSDRVRSQQNTDKTYDLWVVPDVARPVDRYVYFADINGSYLIENREDLNPWWNSDYATIHFRFEPPGKLRYPKADIYVFGELTQFGKADSARMKWNEEERVYQTSLKLKQGYYDYSFVTKEEGRPEAPFHMDRTEGHSWETENSYMVLVYYRELGGRYDQLVAMTRLNSRLNRTQSNF